MKIFDKNGNDVSDIAFDLIDAGKGEIVQNTIKNKFSFETKFIYREYTEQELKDLDEFVKSQTETKITVDDLATAVFELAAKINNEV